MVKSMTLKELDEQEANKDAAKGFLPVPRSLNKARRYYSPSLHTEISVRQYQKLQRGENITNEMPISGERVREYNDVRSQTRQIANQQKFFKVVEAGNQGASVQEALRAGGLTRKQFESIREKQHLEYGGYAYNENGTPVSIGSVYEARFRIPAFSPEGFMVEEFASFNQENASIMGRYWDAVGRAFDKENPDTSYLRNFGNPTVVTTDGRVIHLETNLAQMDLFFRSMPSDVYEHFDEKLYELLKGTSARK